MRLWRCGMTGRTLLGAPIVALFTNHTPHTHAHTHARAQRQSRGLYTRKQCTSNPCVCRRYTRWGCALGLSCGVDCDTVVWECWIFVWDWLASSGFVCVCVCEK